MSKSPCISVIVPVKNGEAHLKEALLSICSQTFPDFELLIIDDHSTDGTMAICQQLASADSRVRTLTNIGHGLVSGLNTGIGVAKGTYIARMDADDISHPERFEKQYRYLAEHPDCDVVGSFMRIFGWSTSEGFARSAFTDVTFPTTHEQMAHALKSVGSYWILSHPAVMLKADSIRAVGGYRDRYARAEDLDLWVRLVLAGYRLGNVGESLLDYRASETSVTSVGRLERYLSTSVLIGYIRDGDNRVEGKVDVALSIDSIDQYGHAASAFERVSDLVVLLRGVGQESRLALYSEIRDRYSDTFKNFSERLLTKARDPKSWPSTVDQTVIDDIQNIFVVH